MGHVDHGKTSLLDAIRHANVVAGEAGGITQHIGAYQVIAPGGEAITFIDTPGHAAFTAMRARGAKVTDIVVLVVAADDGVMPQTIEAIRHAKAAKAPDHRRDQQDRQARGQSAARDAGTAAARRAGRRRSAATRWPSRSRRPSRPTSTSCSRRSRCRPNCSTSRPIPTRNAEGTVIEARLDRGRGPVATVLVQRGTLRVGDLVVAGSQWGRVRALINDKGETVDEAPPSTPVEVLGFYGAPEAGDRVAVVEIEARAREITEYRERMKREKAAARGAGVAHLAQRHDEQPQGRRAARRLPIVVKGDVQGSVEAITAALEKLGNEEVAARVIHGGVGGVTESDVTLAEPRRRSSSASTCAPTRKRATSPSSRASRSATTTSSTIWWMT